MTEIERMIEDYDYNVTDLAKAIEQYIIKARIEENEWHRKNIGKHAPYFLKQRIAQLKKGLNDEREG